MGKIHSTLSSTNSERNTPVPLYLLNDIMLSFCLFWLELWDITRFNKISSDSFLKDIFSLLDILSSPAESNKLTAKKNLLTKSCW
jgi:hypothetical protein